MYSSIRYLSKKISDKKTVEKLSGLKGTEVWNMTYSEAIDYLGSKGYAISVEPSETKSTANGVSWSSRCTVFTKEGNGFKLISFDSAYSFFTAEQAALSAIGAAIDDCISKTQDRKMRSRTVQDADDGTRKTKPIQHDDSNHDKHRKYGAGLYGRHSEEDPYPFE